jgi:hypothetical protein
MWTGAEFGSLRDGLRALVTHGRLTDTVEMELGS